MERRSFLKALVAVPFAPTLLRGMSWAAPTQEELDREIRPDRPRRTSVYTAEVPPGSILPWAGEGAPPGFLPCDGRAIPRFAYRRLHDAIGDAYGGGRFVFRVPDLTSRPAGALEYEAKTGQPAPAWAYVIRT